MKKLTIYSDFLAKNINSETKEPYLFLQKMLTGNYCFDLESKVLNYKFFGQEDVYEKYNLKSIMTFDEIEIFFSSCFGVNNTLIFFQLFLGANNTDCIKINDKRIKKEFVKNILNIANNDPEFSNSEKAWDFFKNENYCDSLSDFEFKVDLLNKIKSKNIDINQFNLKDLSLSEEQVKALKNIDERLLRITDFGADSLVHGNKYSLPILKTNNGLNGLIARNIVIKKDLSTPLFINRDFKPIFEEINN